MAAMEAFVWDQNFVTALPHVDEQHHVLVDLFNELAASFLSTGTQREELLTEIYQRLIDYTQVHFRDEERLMATEGVDSRHIDVHRALHHQFVDQVERLWLRRGDFVSAAETFVGFLTSWLGLHILGIDQSMARQIRAIRSGVAPAAAFEAESAAYEQSTQALLKMIVKLYQVLSAQNAELAQNNQRLEERVAERTEALARANDELRQAYVRLEAYSHTDGLLKIANRAYFDERLADACAMAFRREERLGVLMIDVDCFKRFNDHYGHQAGDRCLQAVAQAVQGALLRSTDLVARYGGEELVVLLPDTDCEGTQAVAQRVVDAVRALDLPHVQSTVTPWVTVSVGGVSHVPSSRDAGAALLAEADTALYQAKAGGRNRAVCVTMRSAAAGVAPSHAARQNSADQWPFLPLHS